MKPFRVILDSIIFWLFAVALLFGAARYCAGQPPIPPIPISIPTTNTGPEMVNAPWKWDPSPSSNVVYRLAWDTNEVWTTNTTATLLMPVNERERVSLCAYFEVWQEAELYPSEDVGRMVLLTWSNCVEVVAVNPLLLRSLNAVGPFKPTGTDHLEIPQQKQKPQEYFVAVADTKITNKRTLIER